MWRRNSYNYKLDIRLDHCCKSMCLTSASYWCDLCEASSVFSVINWASPSLKQIFFSGNQLDFIFRKYFQNTKQLKSDLVLHKWSHFSPIISRLSIRGETPYVPRGLNYICEFMDLPLTFLCLILCFNPMTSSLRWRPCLFSTSWESRTCVFQEETGTPGFGS